MNVALVEFATPSDRGSALAVLKNADVRDSCNAKIISRSALTFSQRERSRALIKAKDLLEEHLQGGETVAIDFKARQVLVESTPAFSQKKDVSVRANGFASQS